MTGHWFSTFALLLWPLVAAFLYRAMPVAEATAWTILGGMLLLPSDIAIKIPMVPPIDKNTIPNVCAVVGCVLLAARPERIKRRSRVVDMLIALYLISPVITSALNNDPVFIGDDRILPGVGTYDGISAALGQLWIFLPFLVARRYLRKRADFETMLRALVTGGLLYSLPMLFEMRMSPQLSLWIYGSFTSSFAVEVRNGGFRPVVFMHNGLIVAFFITTCFLASMALWRTRIRIRHFAPPVVMAYLGVIVVLCKSAGVLLYGITGGSLLAFAKPRVQIRVAVVLVSIGLLYPVLRVTKVFPTIGLVETVRLVSDERAESLAFRFAQEDQLLSHASDRFLFGWGRYARSRVFNEESGGDQSITDGMWIITLGSFGACGFIAQFGLLAFSVFRAAPIVRIMSSERDRILIAALGLIVAFTVVEQLPNAGISPWSWLLAGALVGRSEAIQSTRKSHKLQDFPAGADRQARLVRAGG
jgi:hypothetical protein